jgi:hypothetical protein
MNEVVKCDRCGKVKSQNEALYFVRNDQYFCHECFDESGRIDTLVFRLERTLKEVSGEFGTDEQVAALRLLAEMLEQQDT